MSNYRRVFIPGAKYFFTLVTYNRQPLLTSTQSIKRIYDAFKYVLKKLPFTIDGLVILPDHLHCIWQLPEDDYDYPQRWNLIKRYFSLGVHSEKINKRREKNIWQKRYWEHLIRDEDDLETHLDYIYYNPVKHGFVTKPSDWPYSTFHRDVERGLYKIDWGSDTISKIVSNLNLE
ncbi:MAG: transposase [Gammaproteobacteria bacterium]